MVEIRADYDGKFGNTVWDIFLREHIIDANASKCQNNNHQTSWTLCVTDAESNMDKIEVAWVPPHPYTDPESTLLFLSTHLVLHFVWFLASLGMWFGAHDRWKFIWLVSTSMVLLFGAVASSLYASDEIPDARDCYNKNITDVDGFDKFKQNNLVAKLLLPLYWSYGVLIWFIVLAFWCLVLRNLCTQKTNVPRVPKGRSLSELQPEEEVDSPPKPKTDHFPAGENNTEQTSEL